VSLVLRNARIVGGPDEPVDLRSRHGVIVELGHGLEASAVVDLGGRWVAPGLWDGHVHSGQAALAAHRLDVSTAGSAAEVASLVRDRVEAAPPAAGEVLVGTGFRDGLWPDAPSLELLDAGPHAVALISGDVHCVWSNRAALRIAGRPESDWLLREQAAFDLNVELSRVDAATLDRWILELAAAAARRGVVGIRDLEMDDAPAAWARRVTDGFRGLRVAAGVYPTGLDTAVAAGWRTGEAVEGTGGLVEVGHYKLFADGSLNTRTAWCDEPYPGTDDAGLPAWEPGGLLAEARRALAAGLAPTIHAIGDRAVAEALDVFEELGAPGRIEHAQLVRDADLPRFAALGVVASVQPEHAMDDRDVADRYWAGRTARSFPYRALLDAGATIELGSDAPVAPLDPWVAIAAAVTRSRDGRPAWHPEQGITAAEALTASTRSAVALAHPADLVVLDADPLAAESLASGGAALRGMPVAGTLVAGEWSYFAM